MIAVCSKLTHRKCRLIVKITVFMRLMIVVLLGSGTGVPDTSSGDEQSILSEGIRSKESGDTPLQISDACMQ